MKFIAVRWSRDGRPVLEYRHASGARVRHRLPRHGSLTMREASAALDMGNNAVRLYRMKRRGELKTIRVKGSSMVRVAELARVRRTLKGAA